MTQELSDYQAHQTPNEIVDEAIKKHNLDSLYVLYSGGKDSVCVLHFIAENYPKQFKGAVFTNVGLGAQETRKFVIRYCKKMGWPLFMTWPKEKENFYNTTMKFGFAGPAVHPKFMAYLKGHSWYIFLRGWLRTGQKAAFISGVRKKESKARQYVRQYTRQPINIDTTGHIFIKPFHYKNGVDLWNYYNEFNLEKTSVYAWLNRSGECYCGAFLAEWELKMIEKYDPFAFKAIKWLEKEIQLHGSKKAKQYCKYGGYQTTQDAESQTTFSDFKEELCGESCVPG